MGLDGDRGGQERQISIGQASQTNSIGTISGICLISQKNELLEVFRGKISFNL